MWSLVLLVLFGLAACRSGDDGRPASGFRLRAEAHAAIPHRDPPPVAARLRLIVVDDESGEPLPSRVAISAVPPTPAVRFDISPSTGRDADGEVGVTVTPGVIGGPDGVLLVAGDGTLPIAPGSYSLLASH